MTFETTEALVAFCRLNARWRSVALRGCSGTTFPLLPSLGELKELLVYGCPRLGSPQQLPASLTHFRVSDCPEVAVLPLLPQLAELVVKNCPNIVSLPGLPKELARLWLEGCPRLERLPRLPSALRCLWIGDCPALREPPDMPGSLLSVVIKDCPNINGVLTLPSTTELWTVNSPVVRG